MDAPPEMLDYLVGLFAQWLSPDAAARSAAEQSLFDAAQAPGFALALLGLAFSPLHEIHNRFAAAVHFKNLLHRRWPRPDADADPLPAADCDFIKANFLRLLLEATDPIQAQLRAAFEVPAAADFPSNWQGLLPSIVSALDNACSAGDLTMTKLILDITLCIFRRFGDASDSYSLHDDLKYCHEIFAAPFQAFWNSIDRLLDTSAVDDPVVFSGLSDCALLCQQILSSLTSADIPEDLICNWMTELRTELRDTTNNTEESFHRHVSPLLRLRQEDEDLFQENWVEYFSRDMRGDCMRFLRGPRGPACASAYSALWRLALNHHEELAALVSAQIEDMLASYAADPATNWKDKDAAVYLATTLIEVPLDYPGSREPVINLDRFLESVIVPELQAPDWESRPILKATILMFLHTYSDKMDKHSELSLLPSVIRLLKHESNVVHSYAALYIDRILDTEVSLLLPVSNLLVYTPRYVAADINSVAPQMVNSLFDALSFPGSCDNPYLLRCMMRVLSIANIDGSVVHEITARLVGILVGVCNNPKNIDFEHYLFESLVAVIGQTGDQDQALLPMFEAHLFPVLQTILVDDISEFWPYALQILAELVNLTQPPLSQNYMQLFGVLLSPASWDRPPCVPALARLLRAILRKIPNELNCDDILPNILVIFQSLFSHSSSEDSAFYMLSTLVENVGFNSINPYMTDIWRALFTRLQTEQAKKFVNSVVVFMSHVLVKYGPVVLVSSVTAVQENANLFTSFLERFWIPNLKTIGGYPARKLTAVASTKLLCESPILLDPAAAELWGRLLNKLVAMIDRACYNFHSSCHDATDVVLKRLRHARKSEDDLLQELQDPKHFLATSLGSLFANCPGRFGRIIESHVKTANKLKLRQLLLSYNIYIV